MKISKKIISLILSITMLIGLFTFTTGAIENQQEWVDKNWTQLLNRKGHCS